MLFLAVLLLWPWTAHATCDRDTGPSGSIDCISTTRYSSEQWGTCLTDAYIQQKSKGRHVCEDRTTTYCYYQCMLEVHGEDYGAVTADCACNNGDPVPTQPPSLDGSTLDPLCYSPSGANCDWYRDCLEKKIPCEGTQDGYAVEYADKFCRMFQDRRDRLSDVGQRWMDATRKCLQVSLVPSIRPFEPPTCSSVKKRAFDAHSDCYLQPYSGAPSVCDLSFTDMWTVFWTIKSAFRSEFQETLLGILEVGWGCVGWGDSSIRDTPTALLEVTVPDVPEHLRYRRSVDLPPPRPHPRPDSAIATSASPDGQGPQPNVPGHLRYIRSVDIPPPRPHPRPRPDSAISTSDGPDGQGPQPERPLVATFTENDAARRQPVSPQRAPDDQGPQLRQEAEVRGPSKHRARHESSGQKWTGETELELHYHALAAELCRSVARQLNWAGKGLIWFAYGERSSGGPLLVKILLSDRQTYGLGGPSSGPPANLSTVVQEAAKEVERGKLRVSLRGTRIQLGTFSVCDDVDCRQVSLNVTAPPNSNAGQRSQSALSPGAMVLVLAVTAAAIRLASAPLWQGQ